MLLNWRFRKVSNQLAVKEAITRAIALPQPSQEPPMQGRDEEEMGATLPGGSGRFHTDETVVERPYRRRRSSISLSLAEPAYEQFESEMESNSPVRGFKQSEDHLSWKSRVIKMSSGFPTNAVLISFSIVAYASIPWAVETGR